MKFVASKRSQRGATFLGILTIVAILGFALYAAMRLVPLYKEYMDVSRALTQTATSLGDAATVADIRNSLQRRWEVDDIHSLAVKDVEIRKVNNSMLIRANYRGEVAFIANISLVVDFDKTVSTGATMP